MMLIKEYFDYKRFLLLLQKDLFMIYSNVGVTIAAVAAVLALFNAVTLSTTSSSDFSGLYKFLLMPGGLIVASLAFSDMHKKEKVHSWLMLPASNLEKMIARLFLVSIGYLLITIVVVFLISLISILLYKLFNMSASIPNNLFNPFAQKTWSIVPDFIVFQSIFFLGASYFRKLHFVKTVLSMAMFFIGTAMFSGIIVSILFWDTSNINFNFLVFDIERIFPWGKFQSAGLILKSIAQIFYWVFLPPACWIITYFRVTEAEVHHGI